MLRADATCPSRRDDQIYGYKVLRYPGAGAPYLMNLIHLAANDHANLISTRY